MNSFRYNTSVCHHYNLHHIRIELLTPTRTLPQNLIDQATTLAKKDPYKMKKENIKILASKTHSGGFYNFRWTIKHNTTDVTLGTLEYEPEHEVLTLKNLGSLQARNLLFGGLLNFSNADKTLPSEYILISAHSVMFSFH